MSKPLKILFLPVRCAQFYSTILDHRPLGGTETGIIRVSNELAKMGHEVYIYQEVELPPNEGGVHYISIREFVNIDHFDAVIVIRGLLELFKDLKSKKHFLWTTDSYKSLKTYGVGDKRIVEKIDGLFLLSQWHVDTLCKASGFPRDKTWIVNNGIQLDDFLGTEIRHPKRLIYSSAPDRGLIYMPRIYEALKMRHPDLEFHVFSSLDRYSSGWAPGYRHHENASLYEKLLSLPGCTLHGSILQKDLAREFMKSSLLVYPTNFEETSCITAMEAMAGGCAIVTSHLGALKETIQGGGVFVHSTPGTEEYYHEFIEQTDRLLNDQKHREEIATAGLKRVKNLTWEHSAKSMANYLINFHHLGQ